MQRKRKKVNQLVEHLFRHQSGKIVSVLTRIFGVDKLDLAEDVVQETLLKAMQQWVFKGVPENPEAWILQAAKNKALDVLRRERSFRSKQDLIAEQLEYQFCEESQPPVILDNEFRDDLLGMMFTCCHPLLSREVSVALTLKTLCGFSVAEIARAFLSQEPTIAQRIVRAKRKLRENNTIFSVPEKSEIPDRLDSVLDVLYLLFNEGYSAHEGEDLIRADLCGEAIRLTSILVEHPAGAYPEVHALLAVMLLQASRLPARVDSKGNILLLKEQDRSLWDRRLIQRGIHHLEQSAQGQELTEFHLQAGIAACHAIAESYDSTDWVQILQYYDDLVAVNHSPVIALNRAVALAMVEGPQAGIAVLEALNSYSRINDYYLFPATCAEFYAQLGEFRKAELYLRQAQKLAGTEPEQRLLSRKLREIKMKDFNEMRN